METVALDALFRAATSAEREQRHLDARDRYAEIVHAHRALGRPVHPHVLERFAILLVRLGEYEPAAHLYEAARAISRAGGDAYSVFRMTVGLAQVFLAARDLARAAEVLATLEDDHGSWGRPLPERAGALQDRARTATFPRTNARDLALARAEACSAIARLWSLQGRFAAAIVLADQALADVEAGDVPWLSSADVALLGAEARLGAGDFAAVVALYERFDTKGEQDAQIRWEILRARVDIETGQLGPAKRRLVAALAVATSGRHHGVAIRVAWTLAQLEAHLNRTEDAGRTLARAIDALEGEKVIEAWRGALQSLGALISRRRAAGARELALPPLPAQMVGSAGSSRASGARTEMPQVDESGQAETFLDSIATQINGVLIRLHDSAEALIAAEHLAEAKDEKGAGKKRSAARQRLSEAEDQAADLLACAEGSDSRPVAVRARACAALVRYRLGEYDEARNWLSAAAAEAQRLELATEERQIRRVLGWTCAMLGDMEAFRANAERARELLERIAATLNVEDRAFYLLNKDSAQDEFLSIRARWIGQVREVEGRWFTSIDGWVRHLERGRRALRVYQEVCALTGWSIGAPALSTEPGTGLAPPPDATDGAQIEAWVGDHLAMLRRDAAPRRDELSPSAWMLLQIPRDTAIVAYYTIPDRLLVFVLRWGAITFFEVPVSRLELAITARRVLEETASPKGPAATGGALAAMATLLGLDRIASELPSRVARLVVVPHDLLCNVPFAALRVGEGYLCERFVLAVHFQGRRVLRSRWTSAAGTDGFLGVAIEHVRDGSRLPSLSSAQDEVAVAAEGLGSGSAACTVLYDEAATSARVLHDMQRSAWIHVVAHGAVDPTGVHRTAIVLTGQPGAPDHLSIGAIFDARLDGVRLATLGCCWLSGAVVLPGSEAVSMPAAFLRRGARAVIGALWQVDDQQNVAFMRALYRDVRRPGPAHALARAQRQWIRDGVHPFYWAGHILYGNG